MEETNGEQLAFEIIAAAGEARSLSFGALEAAKTGDFDTCDQLLQQAEEASLRAHQIQTSLLVREANGDHTPVDVMLVHAQDHLMCAMLAGELINEIIELHRIAAKCSE